MDQKSNLLAVKYTAPDIEIIDIEMSQSILQASTDPLPDLFPEIW